MLVDGNSAPVVLETAIENKPSHVIVDVARTVFKELLIPLACISPWGQSEFLYNRPVLILPTIGIASLYAVGDWTCNIIKTTIVVLKSRKLNFQRVKEVSRSTAQMMIRFAAITLAISTYLPAGNRWLLNYLGKDDPLEGQYRASKLSLQVSMIIGVFAITKSLLKIFRECSETLTSKSPIALTLRHEAGGEVNFSREITCDEPRGVKVRSVSRKTSILCSIFLLVAGCCSLRSLHQKSIDLDNSLPIFQKLDSNQKKIVLDNRALHTLGKEKSQNAVLMVGEDRGGDSDLGPHLAYENYNVYAATEIKSSKDFCSVLSRAHEFFKKDSSKVSNIDLLFMQTHGSPGEIFFEPSYVFEVKDVESFPEESLCMNEYLSPNAQIVVASCNGATSSYSVPSIVEEISQKVPGREVSGFEATGKALNVASWYRNGRLYFNQYSIFSRYKRHSWDPADFFNTRRYVDGKKVYG